MEPLGHLEVLNQELALFSYILLDGLALGLVPHKGFCGRHMVAANVVHDMPGILKQLRLELLVLWHGSNRTELPKDV